MIIHKRNEPNLAIEARQDGWNFFEILRSSGYLHELIVPKKREAISNFFFLPQNLATFVFFSPPPENPFLQFTMDFIFVFTVWKFTPKKRPICIEGPAFGAHIMFLGWVKSGYGRFEVWTNVGSVCPFQHTHWILVLRFLQFGHRVWTSIYEGRLFVLFCNYEIHRTGMLQIVFLVSLESSPRGGVHGLGHVVQKFLNIDFFTEN